MAGAPSLASQLRRVAQGTSAASLKAVIDSFNMLLTALSARFSLPGLDLTDTLDVYKNLAGMFTSTFTNTGTGGAQVKIAGGSAGDGVLTFSQGGADIWSIGTDQSDANAFVLALGGVLGVNNAARADRTTRDVAFVRRVGLLSGSTFVIWFQHAASAPHVVTMQDLDGIMALLSPGTTPSPTPAPNTGHVLFTNNTYDIGQAAPPLNPRDLFLARNAAIGGAANIVLALTVGGPATLNGGLSVTGVAAFGGPLTVAGQPVGGIPGVTALPGNYQFTAAFVDVPGFTIPVGVGVALVALVADMICQGADTGQALQARIAVASGTATIAPSGTAVVFTPGTVGERVTVTQQWQVTTTVAAVIKVQAAKTGGSGTSYMVAGNTSLAGWN